MRIVLGFELRFVDPNKFFSFSRLFPKAVVGDAIEPGGKFRLAAKGAEVLIDAQESLLREIFSESEIVARELAEKTADGRLMIPDQLGKGVVIIFNKNPCNEIGIIQRHAPMLHLGGRLFLPCVQSPHKQISKADDERNETEAPGAAFPVIHGAEEHHQASTDHEEDDATAQVTPPPNDGRRVEEGLRNRLALLHHHPHGFVQRAAAGKAEIEDQADDRYRQTEDGEEDDEDDRNGDPRNVIAMIGMTAVDVDPKMAVDPAFDHFVKVFVIIRSDRGCRGRRCA